MAHEYQSIQQMSTVHIRMLSGEMITVECPIESYLQDLIPFVHRKLEERGEHVEQERIRLFSFSEEERDDMVEDMKIYGLFIMDPPIPVPQEIVFRPQTWQTMICSKLAEWIGRQFTSIAESEYRTGRFGQRLPLPRLPRQITRHPQYMPPRILRQLPHIQAICHYARSRLMSHYWNQHLLSLHLLYQEWLETLPPQHPIQTPQDYFRIFVELHIDHFNWGLSGSRFDTFNKLR